MKKIVIIVAVFTVCFFSCGCGKTDEVRKKIVEVCDEYISNQEYNKDKADWYTVDSISYNLNSVKKSGNFYCVDIDWNVNISNYDYKYGSPKDEASSWYTYLSYRLSCSKKLDEENINVTFSNDSKSPDSMSVTVNGEYTYTGEDEMERESKIAEELKWKKANENKDYNWAWAFN